MFLSRVRASEGIRLQLGGDLLPAETTLSGLLRLSHAELLSELDGLSKAPGTGELLCPAEPNHEIWASGVTYLRSRDARKLESKDADVYERVYDAERPELFFKANGWRAVGDGVAVRVRQDSNWDVPEAELCLVLNSNLEIVGYCAGNDMSSRQIEGDNPLYLPQAKMYDGACALGPGIRLLAPEELASLNDLPIRVTIRRGGVDVFADDTSTGQMKRSFTELVSYLGRELTFPDGAFLMTGTGVVPPDSFTLQTGDEVRVRVGELTLSNPVT